MSAQWGYGNDNGPSTWSNQYAQAAGKHQSPIDIKPASAIFDHVLTKNPFVIEYGKANFTNIKNTGHSFTVSGSDDAHSKVTGGPVIQHHKFLQFHMHWGQNDNEGSEHTVDGQSYAAEIHFVHWNSEKFKSASEAVNSTNHDGLMVLGTFVKVGKHNNEFDKLVSSLSRIAWKGHSVDLTDELDVRRFYPDDLTAFYTYDGSLTTPPCNECVKWVVFRDPIEISSQQLDAFRNLNDCSDPTDCGQHKMSHNFRPVCELNDRTVRRSF